MRLNLTTKYEQMQQKFEELTSFEAEKLNRSRTLFDFSGNRIKPHLFAVWTCLVGLPLPKQLEQNLTEITEQVQGMLPVGTSFYPVRPDYYHWELFIIKRPHETVSEEQLQ